MRDFIYLFSYHGDLYNRLNSREVIHGQGVNEEDVLSRRGNASAFSASGRTNTSVRFDVVETKPGINIDVPHASEGGKESQSKVALDEDDAIVSALVTSNINLF